MNKDVRYLGYTTNPSDYDAQDGTLAVSLNLLNEDGAIRPIAQPKTIAQSNCSLDVIFLHKLPDGSTNYIMTEGAAPISLYYTSDTDLDDFKTVSLNVNPKSLTSIGNTLIASTAKGILYFIWRDGTYIELGNRPQFVPIEFGIEKLMSIGAEREIVYPLTEEQYNSFRGLTSHGGASSTHRPATPTGSKEKNDVAAFYEHVTTAIYGSIFEGVKSAVDEKGMLFYQPFMVRYAFRLFDGSYSWHSSPVLMLPTTIPPKVKAGQLTFKDGVLYTSANYLDIPLYRLMYRILPHGNLANWKDIITAIDIFISAPMYTFDQSASIVGSGPISYAKYEGSWRRGRNDAASKKISGRLESICRSSELSAFQYNLAPDFDAGPYWLLTSRENEICKDICDCHDFYRVASIPLDKLTSSTQLAPVDFDDDVTLDNLVTRPVLPDEYLSHHTFIPSVLYTYNSRLNIADIDIKLPESFPVRVLLPFTNPTEFKNSASVSIRISYRKDGRTLHTYHVPSDLGISSPENSADVVDLLSADRPVYLYIPDRDAFEICFFFSGTGKNNTLTLPLTPHDFLNGAYYFDGLDIHVSQSPLGGVGDYLRPAGDVIYHRRNRIYLSDVNNPFVFSAQSMTDVGNGVVLALATAARPLSQGQFGQFPLYAFTDQGIWALEVSATGTYAARQPIVRDVCINPDGIVSIDSAVLFASDRGIMLLSGSTAQCISDTISTDHPFDCMDKLPSFDFLHNLIDHDTHDMHDNCFPQLPFSEFLNGCGFIYDYANQRIVVYNPISTYAYVYSLESKMWGGVYSDIMHGLNSYPDALAVTRDFRIVNMGAKSESPYKGLLITRPIKLDMPDVFKTLRCIIQRGHFRKGHVQSVLYGSRDLFSWHIVKSSTNHYLRGFSGTPYKYFRIGLVCDMSADESLSGVSMDFVPRFSNHIR